ncbi:unnamed protein product, partial [Polarella glacialis]
AGFHLQLFLPAALFLRIVAHTDVFPLCLKDWESLGKPSRALGKDPSIMLVGQLWESEADGTDIFCYADGTSCARQNSKIYDFEAAL